MTTAHPLRRRGADEQRKLDAALSELFERLITFNQVLGMKVALQGSTPPRVRFDWRPELVGHYQHGRLHGGVIAAVLDATGGLGVMHAIGEKHCDESADQVMHRFNRIGTIDLRTDFLRQGLGRWCEASVEVLRLGGRLASTTMRLTNDEGTLIASAAGSYVLT